MPSIGLGRPNVDDCGVIITEPHARTGLMLHDGTYDGFCRIAILSWVSVRDASNPTAPAISTHQALGAETRDEPAVVTQPGG